MPSIKSLVDRGIELRTQIQSLKKELDQVEAKLTAITLWTDHVPLVDPDRDGRRYLARGSADVVPVIFTADKLIASFTDNAPTHKSIATAAAGKLPEFYAVTTTWKTKIDDGKKFRAHAAAILAEQAPAFITACLSKDKYGVPRSDIKIAWDSAQPI